jgi:diacylglycerol O-acyltransferase / wax synthase
MRPRFDRLGDGDLANLAVEAADTPMHVGALLVCDGSGLLDAEGQLRVAEIRARIERRLDLVPRLRTVLHRPAPLGGRPVWVDDPDFAVERHVDAVAVPAPGGEQELLRLTERLLGPVLDRSRPLWRMWFVTGLAAGRVAVVVKLHHAIADGLAAVHMLGALLGGPDPAGGARRAWRAAAPPRWRELVDDNLRGKAATAARAARCLADPAAPRRAVRSARTAWRAVARGWGAPRTSLNRPIGAGRRLAVIRLDLAAVKKAAHAYGGRANDVVLDLVVGGMRALLVSRGERVDGVALRAAVAVSLRRPTEAGQAGNRVGGIVVRLPLTEPDPRARLWAITTETRRAKQEQAAGNEQWFVVWLARLGLMRWFSRHQHLTNVVESDVTGPRVPIAVLGARVVDLVPVGVLAGNLTVSFLAFSYAGRLTITVYADADQHPDLPVLLTGVERDWAALTAAAGD